MDPLEKVRKYTVLEYRIKKVHEIVESLDKDEIILTPSTEHVLIPSERAQLNLVESMFDGVAPPTFSFCEANDPQAPGKPADRLIVLGGVENITTFQKVLAGDITLVDLGDATHTRLIHHDPDIEENFGEVFGALDVPIVIYRHVDLTAQKSLSKSVHKGKIMLDDGEVTPSKLSEATTFNTKPSKAPKVLDRNSAMVKFIDENKTIWKLLLDSMSGKDKALSNLEDAMLSVDWFKKAVEKNEAPTFQHPNDMDCDLRKVMNAESKKMFKKVIDKLMKVVKYDPKVFGIDDKSLEIGKTFTPLECMASVVMVFHRSKERPKTLAGRIRAMREDLNKNNRNYIRIERRPWATALEHIMGKDEMKKLLEAAKAKKAKEKAEAKAAEAEATSNSGEDGNEDNDREGMEMEVDKAVSDNPVGTTLGPFTEAEVATIMADIEEDKNEEKKKKKKKEDQKYKVLGKPGLPDSSESDVDMMDEDEDDEEDEEMYEEEG